MKKLVLLSLSLVAVAASSQMDARCAVAKEDCAVQCPPARIIPGETVSSQCPSYKLVPECVKLIPAKLCPEQCNKSCYTPECVNLKKEKVRLVPAQLIPAQLIPARLEYCESELEYAPSKYTCEQLKCATMTPARVEVIPARLEKISACPQPACVKPCAKPCKKACVKPCRIKNCNKCVKKSSCSNGSCKVERREANMGNHATSEAMDLE